LFLEFGLGGIILYTAQYGPLMFPLVMAPTIAFFVWKNEARKTEHREYDDHRAVDPRALEKYLELPGVKRTDE